MATVKTFDRANLKTIRADLEAALAAVSAKHGIALSTGSISFNANSFTTKVTAVVANTATGATVDPQEVKWAAAFNKNHFFTGLKKTDLGKTIKIPSLGTVTIVGLRPKAKAQVVVKSGSGKYHAAYLATVLSAVQETA